MKTAEIRELTDKEVLERIQDQSNTLVRMKMNHAVTPLDNPHKIVDVRRNIAQLKTELRRRQLNQ